jgi:hypothetical protein
MKRVKFFTNLEHEFIQNFKYAQIAFTKLQVEKVKTRREMNKNIAKLSPNSSYSWAELALFSLDPDKPRKPKDKPRKLPDKPRKPPDKPRKLTDKLWKPRKSLF